MKFWFDTLRSRLLLTLITYVLYTLLYILTDEQARDFYLSGDYPAWGYAFDVVTTLVCIFFFVQLSICYSRLIYRCFLSLEHPYRSLIVYSVMLLVMNNLTAYVLSLLTGLLFDMDDLPFFQVQHLYVYSILSAFISSIYTNAHYLHSYMDAEAQKKRLEMVAMQAQLAALKQQIDPHFMFNNFSILSELIMEDRTLAVKFLDKLSKVYRYVIQNYDRDTVPLAQELLFLDSYFYLIEMRYEGAIAVSIAPELARLEGEIPPVSLQLLVENALKHNRFSEERPQLISISAEDDCLVVANTRSPLKVPPVSTGVGLRNIHARYALLSDRLPRVEQTEDTFTVSLPILHRKEEDL